METRIFGVLPNGEKITEYSLISKNGIQIKVIDYGCTITSMCVPDFQGHVGEVVLGFDTLEEYLSCKHYVGCIVGRYANRIAYGKFNLQGKKYQVAVNHSPHHLHGGFKGFDKVVWSSEPFENENGYGVNFKYLSRDGEEGFPGNLTIEAIYFLEHSGQVSIRYHATTDQTTVINLTQHCYFNLNGRDDHILEHEVMINANHFLPVDTNTLPTGEIRHVSETPFDFRAPRKLSGLLKFDDEQLKMCKGFDHSFILAKEGEEVSYAATLYHQPSGRKLELYTSEPGLQFYTGNFLDDGHTRFRKNSGLCLEAQHFPDSPNRAGFPSVTLHPGEEYQSTTLLKFSAVQE